MIATPNHEIFSGYLQDTWKVLPNLTVNAGVRYEQQLLKGLGDVTYINVNHFSPRVGFSWDFLNNGKSRFYGSYGQFVQAIPLDMNIRSLNGERDATVYNFSPTSLNCDPAAETLGCRFCRIAGTSVNAIDPNLKSEYQRKASSASSTRSCGAPWNSASAVSTAACSASSRTRATGRRRATTTPSSIRARARPAVPADFASCYNGRRLRHNATSRASRSRSRRACRTTGSCTPAISTRHLKGNFDGSFREIGGFNAKDPNITDDFDYPAFVVNSGRSPDDRPSQPGEGAGRVHVPLQPEPRRHRATTLSGTPLSQVGWYDNYGGPELFLAPRGTIGRSPATYEMNTQLDYALMFNPVTIHILADLFNILNKQQTTHGRPGLRVQPGGQCAAPGDQCPVR